MEQEKLTFYGGATGALIPFVFFLGGVAALGLSGAPDERGFWPILLGAFALGVLVARDRHAYAESYLRGMSQPIVLTMVLAWILAGVLGSLIGASGVVPALTSVVARLGVQGGGFVVAAFLVCSIVSTATGTSLGTILVCGPLLYPAGGALDAAPAALIGAILGGATFGDNISPVSDTTIASAATQRAGMREVVRSRLGYALPAATLAMLVYALIGGRGGPSRASAMEGADLAPLVMLLAPAVSIVALLRQRHLAEGLLYGCLAAVGIGLVGGLFSPADLLHLDRDDYIARGLVLSGMERAVGVSIFTLLLMGLVAPLESAGLLPRWLDALQRRARTRRGAELTIFGAVSTAVVLTTHSVVAILATGKLARELGSAHGIARTRCANLLDVTVCTYPFLLPFFIPTILAATTTASGAEAGLPRVSPLEAGLHNAHSWALLIVVLGSILLRRR